MWLEAMSCAHFSLNFEGVNAFGSRPWQCFLPTRTTGGRKVIFDGLPRLDTFDGRLESVLSRGWLQPNAIPLAGSLPPPGKVEFVLNQSRTAVIADVHFQRELAGPRDKGIHAFVSQVEHHRIRDSKHTAVQSIVTGPGVVVEADYFVTRHGSPPGC